MFHMHISNRMQALPTQFFASLVAKTNAAVAAGHDVINLGQGNPDLPTPPHIVDALKVAADKPVHHKYPPFRGHRFLKEAIVKRYKADYGVDLDPDTEVAITFGGKTGLVELPMCVLNPGDVCLVPDPGYPDYWSGLALASAEMRMMPLLEKNGYLPDFNAIPLADLDAAKLMYVNYPNNPTGATAPLAFYEQLIAIAKKNNFIVASDFAYGAIGFDGQRPISFLQASGAKEVGVEFYTLSKSYNMAGWRVGFALGNAEIIKQIELIQDHYYVSLFGGIQEAAAVALTDSQQCVHDLVATYEARRQSLMESLQEIGWQANAPQGSFFAWLPVPDGYTSAQFADSILEHAHVVMAPGIGFGPTGEGYVRCALLADASRIREAIARIGRLSLF
jgi:aminotransferase